MNSRPALALLAALVFPQFAALGAQPPQPFAWVRHGGTNNFENARSIAVDRLGNVILGVHFNGTTRVGTNVFTSTNGNTGSFVAKFDSGGSNVWARGLPASADGDNTVEGVTVDAAGNAYATGGFTGTLDFGGSIGVSSGSNDLFAAKYDPDGNLAWVFTGGGVSRDEGFDIGVDAAGNAYIAGIFRGTSTYGGSNVVASGSGTEFLLLKLNASGQMAWVLRGGGSGSDETRGLVVDAAGNCYVAAVFGGTATYSGSTFVGAGGLDALFLKYDPSGNLLWSFQGGGPGGDEAKKIAVDGSSNVYFNGYFSNGAQFGTYVLTSTGGFDIYTAKLNPAGQLQWIRTGGGPDNDSGRGIAVDREGNVYTSGWVQNDVVFDGVLLTNLGNPTPNDIPLLKYDRDGNLQWAQRFGGTAADEAEELVSDALGNIYICGRFAGNSTFGATNLTAAGSADFFWAKLATVTPPTPLLSTAGSNVTISWNVLAAEFRLESASVLGGPTVWTNVPVVPAVVGLSNVVTLPANPAQQFFRLNWP